VVERDGHDVGATNGTSKWKALPHNLSGDHFPPPLFFLVERDGHEVGAADGARK